MMPAMETPDLVLVPSNSPILRQLAAEVTDIATQVLPLVIPMLDLMERRGGIGLAAPQVGIGLRFFVSQIQGHRVVINPAYVPAVGTASVSALEGCLSWPGQRTYVRRYDRIQVGWLDLEGRPQSSELSGLDARVFQHETDHILGVTIFP